MKEGAEATAQFDELVTALREIGAGWVVDEVLEVVARGKVVLLGTLPEEQVAIYRERLSAESDRGLPVGRIGRQDEATVPYTPAERLALLVDAAQRVIAATTRSQVYVVGFAEATGLNAVQFQVPAGIDQTPAGIVRQVSLDLQPHVLERLDELIALLQGDVKL